MSLLCGLILLSYHTVVWSGYLVSFVFVCMVMDFSAAEKDSGAKLCSLVRILSGMSPPILVNFGLRAAPPES